MSWPTGAATRRRNGVERQRLGVQPSRSRSALLLV
jgi:hypothetical protein